MPLNPVQPPAPPQPGVEGDDQRIDHDSRLALSTLEPLGRLKARLQEPDTFPNARDQVDINGIIGKIDSLSTDLESLATASAGASSEEIQQEMQQESEKRSQGQQERQQRLAPCNDKSKQQTASTPLGNTRPQVSGAPRVAVPRPVPMR